jgi:PTH1 family peptidyl-tRNA hydrolase
MLADLLAAEAGTAFQRLQSQALVTTGRLAGRRVVLAKPQSFMNASGPAVGSLTRFYRVDLRNLLVAYDDLDLPLGTLRLRPRGGSGGHRGLASILEALGTDGFARLRLGIGRPPGRMDPADYVLQRFRAEEESVRDLMLAEAAVAVRTYLREGIEPAMSRHNGPVVDPAID